MRLAKCGEEGPRLLELFRSLSQKLEKHAVSRSHLNRGLLSGYEQLLISLAI